MIRPFISLCAVALSTSLFAQTPGASPAPGGRNLTVVTRAVTPFVMKKNDRLTGYSIEMWERVVREARLPFDADTGYKVVDTVPQMLAELNAGHADAEWRR